MKIGCNKIRFPYGLHLGHSHIEGNPTQWQLVIFSFYLNDWIRRDIHRKVLKGKYYLFKFNNHPFLRNIDCLQDFLEKTLKIQRPLILGISHSKFWPLSSVKWVISCIPFFKKQPNHLFAIWNLKGGYKAKYRRWGGTF